jgi:thiamine kinase-like enzyme
MKHKVIKEVDIVYKEFRTKKAYDKEKYFYLTYQDDFEFIPELLDFDDDKKYLIFKNVGDKVLLEKIDLKIINDYYNRLIDEGIFHNDMRLDNILYNPESNKYFIIDFEYWDNVFTDFKIEKRIKRDIRMYLDNYN